MARGKPVELATRTFGTQAEATAFFKEILNRYQPGARVMTADSLELSALLERHSEYSIKVGCGVSHFEVVNTEHGTQCFRLVRTDGSGTDFSYGHCITGRAPSRKLEVCQALRRAVRFDLYAARDKFFSEHGNDDGLVTCAVTGVMIGKEEAHMDHCPPMTFEVIVTTFLSARGIALDAVPLTTGQDEQVAPAITDAALAEAFRVHHANVASLDIVKDKVNLAQASRNRIKSTRITLR
ncbi:MAG: DUF3223 domain-containing protein [Rhodocyclaceae bacterium]|nr:MAG: DUF3223 domain-containing protein [Rhodocyclaceae bacterium]